MILRQSVISHEDTKNRVPIEVDDYDLESFAPIVAEFGSHRFGYVVTPNVDHLIKFTEDAEFRKCYQTARWVLLDSRVAAHLIRWRYGLNLRVCTGSDLTARLLEKIVNSNDDIVIIGSSTANVETVRRRYGLAKVRHYDPPMGFIHDPAAVEHCLNFIEASSPFRFCLLAVGSPQQEHLAAALSSRGRARGLALCIGASINFLAGTERRAPAWMQRMSLEWLFRLLQNPRRLGTRYLVRGPKILSVLGKLQITLRRADCTTID